MANLFRYEVVIRWPGNPDVGQLEPIADSQVIHADTLVSLVEFVRAAIARHDAGSSNFLPDDVYRNGASFCTMSYNGKCFRHRGPRIVLPVEINPAEVDAQTERDIRHAQNQVAVMKAESASLARLQEAREKEDRASRAALLKTMRAPRY